LILTTLHFQYNRGLCLRPSYKMGSNSSEQGAPKSGRIPNPRHTKNCWKCVNNIDDRDVSYPCWIEKRIPWCFWNGKCGTFNSAEDAATHPIRRNRTSLKPSAVTTKMISTYDSESRRWGTWWKVLLMAFSTRWIQRRVRLLIYVLKIEKNASAVALHKFNQVFEEKLSQTWIPNTNSGLNSRRTFALFHITMGCYSPKPQRPRQWRLLNPQAEKLGFTVRNRVIAR
jgi:hypothetical protein